VLESNSEGEATRLALGGNQEMGLDLGKVKIGVFNLRKSASTAGEPARR
jgi:hypothetical protein